MQTEQDTDREPVALEAWRARLCARGLREAYDRMRRATLGGRMDLREALSIAHTMDAAIDMLRETTKRLVPGSDLRRCADEAMAAFVEWRVAAPRTDVSRRAAARFGARVIALEETAIKASRPDAPTSPKPPPSPPPDARELDEELDPLTLEDDEPTRVFSPRPAPPSPKPPPLPTASHDRERDDARPVPPRPQGRAARRRHAKARDGGERAS